MPDPVSHAPFPDILLSYALMRKKSMTGS